MSDIAQARRLLRISSPLGADVLVLRRLAVTEAVGQPFVIEAEVLSARDDLKPADLLGKAVTCTVALGQETPRYFHGMVRAFGRVATEARELSTYRLEAVPRLWHLGRTADCRIFQDQSVKDILTTLLNEGSVAPNRLGTLPTATRPYCVQFNETDFEFVHRLLDEVGGGYFFEHVDGNHTLAVTGANADFPLVPGSAMVVRSEADRPDAVTRWQVAGTLQPGKHHADDFDGLKPNTLLTSDAATVLPDPGASSWEVFRWPSGKAPRPDIDPAKLGMEEDEAGAEVVRAESTAPALFAGGRLKVKPSLAGTEATWLLTAVRHEAHDDSHLAGGGDASYANSFAAIPADRTWRNPHPRRRPVMPGMQSATVTGPTGEEIHCDEYGRIKVHFLWDRAGKRDQTSSCYLRVAQAWGGAWGGAWFLPRIGDEVIVAFLEGDPDRPFVVGSIYNAEGKPPWELPTTKDRSGFRSRSTKGGSRENANIIGFEDPKGSERLYLQAEKDMEVLVKNDLDTTVRDGNETRLVKTGKRTTTIEGDETLTVNTGNRLETIKTGNDTLEVSTGNRSATIKTGNDSLEVSMGNLSVEVKMGNISTKASLGAITEEAMQSITLKVGGNKIVVDQTGITLDGIMVTIKGQAMAKLQSPMTQVNGDGMLMLKGGLVMIN